MVSKAMMQDLDYLHGDVGEHGMWIEIRENEGFLITYQSQFRVIQLS